MSRKSTQEMLIMEDLVIRIITEHQEKSPSQILKYLKEEYQTSISRPTLDKILTKLEKAELKTESKDLYVPVLEMEYENHQEIIKINLRIKTLQEDFANAESVNDRCKISGQIDSAQETKLKLKKILKETDMIAEKSKKVQYEVYFDGPLIAKKGDDKVEKETKENG
jgi:hypothetical protein